jgi:hypothetical protein
MQNILILTVLLINILMKVGTVRTRKNKYKNWSRMDHKPNYFWTNSIIIEKTGKMKT